MAMCQKYDIKNVVSNDDYESGFKIGDISVEPFRIPHDAAYPLAYTFDCQGARCSVATDIGVPTRGVVKNVKDSEVVLLESNHDFEMLKNGKYPPVLKARIMSNQGHLSNDAAARIASILCDDSRIKQLVLGHISENNNTEQKAYDVVENALKAKDSDIELYVAHQSRRSEVFEIL
jgi:phosphoribosyl 1,2-cyclic phosphodiesterase